MSAPNALTRRMVRRYTEGNMNAQITILRGALGTLNTTTGVVGGIGSATTVYEGNARIRTVSGGGSLQTEGGPIPQRNATISIPITAPVPFVDDIVTIQAANRDSDASEADPDLDGRVFRVVDVEGGSFFGDARRMSCTQFFSSRDWTGS